MKSPSEGKDFSFKLISAEGKLLAAGFLLLAATSIATVFVPRIIASIVDDAIVPGNYDALFPLVVLYISVEITRVICGASHTYIFSLTGQRLMHALRYKLFYNFLKLPAAFFARNSSAVVLTRVTNDIGTVGQLFQSGVLQAIENLITILIILAAFFLLDYRFAIMALLPYPLVILTALAGSKLMHRIFKSLFDYQEDFNAYLTESVAGADAIHLFNAEQSQNERFIPLNQKLRKAQVNVRMIFAVFHPFVTVTSAISIASLIWFGGNLIAAGEAQLGILVASVSYVVWLTWPIMTVIDKWNILISGAAAYRRLAEAFEWELEEDLEPIDTPAAHPETALGAVSFENVYFSYDGNTPILENFSLEIKAGESIGIVGPSGSGKSTVLALLRRFYEPDRGRILVDGRDIRSYNKRELRSLIGLVQQDPFIFSGSVEDNISLWEPLSDEVAEDAIEAIFPEAELKKEIAERGANLSLGEKQLISFARSLASKPGIWLLDEASASLDQDSEKRLFEILTSYRKQHTVISIAHRVSTVRGADRIIVLNRGKVVESGNHRELLRKGGLYARLFNLQTLKPAP